ncbi:Phosphate transporter like protein [Aduncisulcus paluster]|uniref:Phosphate transporter n=1 Tax=Aduncisulcus paluster TaxID=2918883 RepID=A0ABQ5KYA8_9EUKA|nr:Phosphate transporter like protein [Aduncisulcus paluster]
MIVGMAFSYAIGCNDLANCVGAAVGSRSLSMIQAVIWGSLFELLGTITLGRGVAATIGKGIIDSDLFIGHEQEYMNGMLAALVGSTVLMLGATFMKLPVSSTHAAVGGILAFGLVFDKNGIDWSVIGKIAISWLASPILGGVMGAIFTFICKNTVMTTKRPALASLNLFPWLCGFTLATITFSIMLSEVDSLAWYYSLAISIGLWILIATICNYTLRIHFFKHYYTRSSEYDDIITSPGDILVLPKCFLKHMQFPDGSTMVINRRRVDVQTMTDASEVSDFLEASEFEGEKSNSEPENEKKEDEKEDVKEDEKEDDIESEIMDQEESHEDDVDADGNIIAPPVGKNDKKEKGCSCLHDDEPAGPTVLMNEFAERGAECYFVPNQLLVSLLVAFSHGTNSTGNATGPMMGALYAYQEKLGEDIDPIDGFVVQMSTIITTLVCSNLNIPASSTHILIGAVTGVGMARSGASSVNWKMLGKIGISWLLTLPISGFISIAIYSMLNLL